jgi:hypothetical protein
MRHLCKIKQETDYRIAEKLYVPEGGVTLAALGLQK